MKNLAIKAKTLGGPLLQLLPVAAVALGLIIGAFIFAKVSPMEAVKTLINSAFGSPAGITATLKETTPLLVAGIAVFIALKAGLFNIGVEGQLLIGAFAAAVVGHHVKGYPGIAISLLAGMAAGMLWALPAGLIKALRNGHEVITTIMLNNIAIYVTQYLAGGPFKDPESQSPRTQMIDPSVSLASIKITPSMQVNPALILGLLLVVGISVWLFRTVSGYELRATGANATAAKFAGVNAKKVIISSMCWSGAIGGLAGALQVLAYEGHYFDGFSPGYGFTSLGVALLAGNTPIGLLPSALLFGALSKGSVSMQAMLSVPKGITFVVMGLLVITYGVVRYRKAATHE